MDINVFPFSISLETQNEFSLDATDLFKYIENQNNSIQKIYDKDRILTIQEIQNSNYISGILLSFRDYESHCKVTPCKNGGYFASIEKIEDGAEYNFFVFNKTTLKGLWLTYFNSASISVLDKIFRTYFNKYANSLGIETSMKFKYHNKIKVSLILAPENIEKALKKFNKINYVEYTERSKECSFFSPDEINYSKKRIFLKRETKIKQTIQAILNLHKSKETENTVITGQVANGKKETLNLDNIFKPWITYKYDEVTASLENFNTNNIEHHKIIKALVECISNNPSHKQIIEAI